MAVNIDWRKYVGEWSKDEDFLDFLNSNYMIKVLKYLSQEYSKYIIYPKRSNIFRAFQLCKPKDLKVVILGQDPYHDGSATGLAFANREDTLKINPSLKQIKNAVEMDINDGFRLDFDYTLESWAKQGVLLLNTALTVQSGQPNSHKKVWDKFTKFVIQWISINNPGTVFLLWGSEAKKYKKFDDFDMLINCYVLEEFHPAYASRNEIDWKCSHFTSVNKLIEVNNGGKEFNIKW